MHKCSSQYVPHFSSIPFIYLHNSNFQIYFVNHNPNFFISAFGGRTWFIYGLKAHVIVNKFLLYSRWWSRSSYGSRSRENEGYSGGLGLRVGGRREWSPVRLGSVEEEWVWQWGGVRMRLRCILCITCIAERENGNLCLVCIWETSFKEKNF